MATVNDLEGINARGAMLLCPQCISEFSACAGDYFWASPDHVFTCCDGVECELVVKTVNYERLEVRTHE